MLGDPGFCFGKLAGLQLVTPFLCDRSHANDAGFLETRRWRDMVGRALLNPSAIRPAGNAPPRANISTMRRRVGSASATKTSTTAV